MRSTVSSDGVFPSRRLAAQRDGRFPLSGAHAKDDEGYGVHHHLLEAGEHVEHRHEPWLEDGAHCGQAKTELVAIGREQAEDTRTQQPGAWQRRDKLLRCKAESETDEDHRELGNDHGTEHRRVDGPYIQRRERVKKQGRQRELAHEEPNASLHFECQRARSLEAVACELEDEDVDEDEEQGRQRLSRSARRRWLLDRLAVHCRRRFRSFSLCCA